MNRVIFIFFYLVFILINYSDIYSFNGSIENDQVAYSETSSDVSNAFYQKGKMNIGFYVDPPLSNGVEFNYNFFKRYFLTLHYGNTPSLYAEMSSFVADKAFSWWNDYYSGSFEEVFTGLKRTTIRVGKLSYFEKKRWDVSAGFSFYRLNYSNVLSEFMQTALGVTFDSSIDDDVLRQNVNLSIKGKGLIFKLNVTKTYFPFKSPKVGLDVGVNLNYIKYVSVDTMQLTSDEMFISDLNDIYESMTENFDKYINGLIVPNIEMSINYYF